MKLAPKEKAIEMFRFYLPNMYCFFGSGMLTNTYDDNVAMTNARQCVWREIGTVQKELELIFPKESSLGIRADREKYWKEVIQIIPEITIKDIL